MGNASQINRSRNSVRVERRSDLTESDLGEVYCRLDVRKYSFSQRTINVWNKLSTDCVHASSVNMFKNKIDKYLDKAGYT